MKYEAPAKLNLNLLVSGRDTNGMHPLRSVVQTIDWCDLITFEVDDEDSFEVHGLDLPDDEENLVVRALNLLRTRIEVPSLHIGLEKRIPIEAGLGGGSSDAAATLEAAIEITGGPASLARELAPELGADVSFPLVGGTAEITGYGDRIGPMPPLGAMAVAVVIPEFGLSTPAVYEMWDRLGEPEGFAIPDRLLPPGLRNLFPLRNDLYRAAVAVEPALGDFVADTASTWDTPVMMTGSGSGCFGFFPTVEEAIGAANEVKGTRASTGAALRPTGVARVD